jgi:hypothetical protein
VNVATFTEFSAVIHANIFVGTLGSVAGEPAVDPVDRWGLCRKGSSEYQSTEMVGEEDVAGFAIETDKIVMSVGVAALLGHETKIDGQTLVACRRSHRRFLSGRCLAKFRGETDRAFFYFGRDLKLWHAFDEAMHL